MSKYIATERTPVKSIVASLSIKRIPETEIMKEVFAQTNKSISRAGLYKVKQSIKKESYEWMINLAKNQHNFLHEFKERVDEIIWLQRKHHELIDELRKYLRYNIKTHILLLFSRYSEKESVFMEEEGRVFFS